MTRLKNDIKFTITEIVRGRISKAHVVKGLGGLTHNLSQRLSVVEVLIEDPKSDVQYRAIGIWNKRHKQYHWCITNLKVEAVKLKRLYTLRRQVELTFKALKSTLNFSNMSSLGPNTVISLALISTINCTLAVALRVKVEVDEI